MDISILNTMNPNTKKLLPSMYKRSQQVSGYIDQVRAKKVNTSGKPPVAVNQVCPSIKIVRSEVLKVLAIFNALILFTHWIC